MKGFNDYHKTDVKIAESEAEFYERAIKHKAINSAQYPDLTKSGLEGPYQDLNGKVYYYDTREGMFYLPDTDVYVTHKDLRLP
ncbi:hypothetical protein VPHD479_0254 [Vibrio phage D479]